MRKYVLERTEIDVVRKKGTVEGSYVLDVPDNYFRTMGLEQSKNAMKAAEEIVKAAGVEAIRPIAFKNPDSIQKCIIVAIGELDDVTREMLSRVEVPRYRNTLEDAEYTPVAIEICPLDSEADF